MKPATDEKIRAKAMMRSATLKDVARRAGVGPATVSVALNGSRSGTRISEETRQRIHQAAKDLSYRPNGLARSLKGGRTNILGFYRYFALGGPSAFDAEINAGLQEGCIAEHMDLLLHGTFQGRSSEDIYARLLDRRIDGLILLAFPNDPLAVRLAESDFPVVALADALPDIPSVVVDDKQGGRLVAAHLHEKGHRDVVYMTLKRDPVSMLRRFDGFREEAEARGMRIRTFVATDGAPPDWGIPSWEDPIFASYFEGPMAERPTAFACWADIGAETLLSRFQERGIRVPHDVAVIGYDGIQLYGQTIGGLSTVIAPWRQAGKTAVSLLCQRLRGEEVPAETVLPVQILPGETT